MLHNFDVGILFNDLEETGNTLTHRIQRGKATNNDLTTLTSVAFHQRFNCKTTINSTNLHIVRCNMALNFAFSRSYVNGDDRNAGVITGLNRLRNTLVITRPDNN